MAGLFRLLYQKWHPPKEPTESFAGKTVLITGTTSGLGLAAAKKLAGLNVSTLIITGRSYERAEKAKREIEECVRAHAKSSKTKSVPDTEIVVEELDMSSAAKVEAFVTSLKSRLGKNKLDAVILNAGVIPSEFKKSPDGFEEAIQVNTVSTFLLAVLLLPLLLDRQTQTNRPSHLTFVSSSLAHVVTLTSVAEFLTAEKPLSAMSEEENFPHAVRGRNPQYPRSKMLLEHAIRHLAASPLVCELPSGQPRVIINSVCPGMCKSDLGRNIIGRSWAMALFAAIFMSIFARSAGEGANAYISALLQGAEGQGQTWSNDTFREPGELFTSKQGRELGQRTWSQLLELAKSTAASVVQQL